MQIPLVDLKKQYLSIKDEIDSAIQEVLDNTAFILGKKVEDFEGKFARLCNAKHCVGVNNGTSALRLALLALGIKAGDEVITTPFTFIATAEAISHIGASPVFVDIDEKTYCIDPEKIREKITKKTKAIIPVHLFGQSADMDPILEIAKKHNLKVIEDAAQAHNALYKDKKAGSMGDASCFSFYPGKNLGAYGEAGAVCTNNKEIAKELVLLRQHGELTRYYHDIIGDNCRMEAIQGAVLGVKIKYIEEWTEKRRKNAEHYNKLLKESGIALPYEADYARHVYHIYAIRLKNRDMLREFLGKNGVSAGIHYPIPVHLQKAYSFMGMKKGSFPVSEKVAGEILSLPMYPELSEEQMEYVSNSINDFIKNA
ncbi:DegT/DnrJ/EryC1/StrS family aminotransferase [Candidatus Woesearchaeota archaeon]|nr:DegT/DnrJ/EryC1/StrS family aminotransferase [Candidatus Woesearchaeota archaeon]